MNHNVRKFLWIILGIVLISGTCVFAEDVPRAEVSVTAGWTFSDGVTGDSILAANGQIYDRVDPKDSFNFGFTGEYFVTPSVEVGFRFNRQKSKLEIGGTTTTEIGDMNVDNWHGIFSYNFGDPEASTRPFIYGGLGATHYGGVDFTFNGVGRTINSLTKFSSTWGGGLKFHASKNVGVKVEGTWTPTHIKTDEAGWFCDPFWGCYLVGNAQYSNQFGFDGGINFRF